MSKKTKQDGSSTISLIFENSFMTSLPLSENHLLNNECALISISIDDVKDDDGEAGESQSRIASFWAIALHNDVFPVPGGPVLLFNHGGNPIYRIFDELKVTMKEDDAIPTDYICVSQYGDNMLTAMRWWRQRRYE